MTGNKPRVPQLFPNGLGGGNGLIFGFEGRFARALRQIACPLRHYGVERALVKVPTRHTEDGTQENEHGHSRRTAVFPLGQAAGI